MVESTCFQHTSSHPDKYNNSVDRIISKEEEREDPRRDTSIFEYSGVSTFYKNYSVSTRNPVIPCKENYSTYRINSTTRNLQEILQLQGSSRADHYKASSSNCSRVSKHPTRQNSTPSGSQHSRSPYSSSKAHSYRILPGEIGFIPKGLSIVCPCNT